MSELPPLGEIYDYGVRCLSPFVVEPTTRRSVEMITGVRLVSDSQVPQFAGRSRPIHIMNQSALEIEAINSRRDIVKLAYFEQSTVKLIIEEAGYLYESLPCPIYERLSLAAPYIVPLFGILEHMETSLSAIDIPGVSFISPKKGRRFLEAVVHEAAHQELFMYEKVAASAGEWDIENRHTFGSKGYSPWRKEERPAIMLLHGAYVFMRIRHVCMELGIVGDAEKGKIEMEVKHIMAHLRSSFVRTVFVEVLDRIEYEIAGGTG